MTWHGLVETITHPTIGLLVVVGFLAVLAFASLEGTFSLFLGARMRWGPREATYGFAFLGLVSALVQGGLIRRLVPRFGEPRLIVAGVATLAAGMACLALARSVPTLLGATVVVAVGQGLASPTVSGLLSRVTPPGEQGAIFGTLTSAQTLARMVNYLVANALLARVGPSAPYWEASMIALVAVGMALVVARRVAVKGMKVEAETLPESVGRSADL